MIGLVQSIMEFSSAGPVALDLCQWALCPDMCTTWQHYSSIFVYFDNCETFICSGCVCYLSVRCNEFTLYLCDGWDPLCL